MITLHGVKNCDTIKGVRRWSEVQDIDYRFRDCRVDGLSNTLLWPSIGELGWEALLNTCGTTWRKLDEFTCDQITDAASVAALTIETPAIIERPLLCAPGKPMLLGFSESSYTLFFNEVWSMSYPVIELTRRLIRHPSLSPDDAGCQTLMTECLRAVGFTVERMDFGDTQNFWAWRGRGETPAFAGHTDVVPTGDVNRWINPPFEPIIYDGMLFGRGVADMKGSLAAMAVAAERFAVQHPNHQGRLALLITSDREINVKNGTTKVVEALMARNERPDYCLVDEPFNTEIVGDVVKNRHHNSLTRSLTIHDVQGHVVYPHLADDLVHRAAPMLNELVAIEWNRGNGLFPTISMQIVNIQTGTSSSNVILGEPSIQFSFRFSAELTDETTRARVRALLEKRQLRYIVDWRFSDQPFLTERGKLVDAVMNAIEHCNEIRPQLPTTDGMSDGHFIARMGAQVAELGPVNATTHKINEYVNAADLQLLVRVHQRIMEQLVA